MLNSIEQDDITWNDATISFQIEVYSISQELYTRFPICNVLLRFDNGGFYRFRKKKSRFRSKFSKKNLDFGRNFIGAIITPMPVG